MMPLNLISLNSIKSKDILSESEFDYEFESKATMKKTRNRASENNEIKQMLI